MSSLSVATIERQLLPGTLPSGCSIDRSDPVIVTVLTNIRCKAEQQTTLAAGERALLFAGRSLRAGLACSLDIEE
ncbi:hypothetical protein GCM10007880_60770 [Mesorhizobium amorphae]|uniref:hypothetical protein n=1 Tax=Mesorhizobium amorphae TaxID=71433 RepID=UPI00235CE2AC|nr:hypothetical protein [Mesorhizobium amorphae]GLR45559.1 hypothetical protein GCM10007880_60770 [Mesorhizobium amorphae]